MNQLTFFKWGFALLLVLNICLLGLPYIMQRRPPQPGPERLELRLMEQVGFDQSQADEFKVLADNHHQEMQAINREHTQLLIAYFDTHESDTEQRNSILNSAGELDRERIELTYNHFEDIRKITRDDQLEAFEKFRTDALRRVLPTRSGPPPPRPPRGD